MQENEIPTAQDAPKEHENTTSNRVKRPLSTDSLLAHKTPRLRSSRSSLIPAPVSRSRRQLENVPKNDEIKNNTIEMTTNILLPDFP